MRIRDWSSDVCSSDLINSPVHLRIDTRGVDAGEIERGGLDLLQVDETALDQAAIEIVVAVRQIFATRIEAAANPGIPGHDLDGLLRPAERRVGNVCVSTCRSRYSRYLTHITVRNPTMI